MFQKYDISRNACQLFGCHPHCGKLVDEVYAQNIGCEYGEYDR